MVSKFLPVLALLAASLGASANTALPFDLGGDFTLTDQSGATRTQADPDGNPQLLFFGYANCREICSAALPLMGQVTDILAKKGVTLTPMMITVDPTRDTVDTIGVIQDHHDRFVGLTGDETALQVAYDAYQIETEVVFVDPEYGPVMAHGSFIFLLDPEGEVMSVMPPILDPDGLAAIVAKYTLGEE